MTFPDADHPSWPLLSGLIVMGATAMMLYCNYQQWETPKDLTTIVTVGVAYFAANIGKRIICRQQKSKG